MERKMACRALGIWPKELADIIAEYSDWTISEKVIKLIGKRPPKWSAIMSIIFESPMGMRIEWSRFDGNLYVNTDRYGHDNISHAYGVFFMSPEDLCDAVISRYWRNFVGVRYGRRMTDWEIAIMDAWLATVK